MTTMSLSPPLASEHRSLPMKPPSSRAVARFGVLLMLVPLISLAVVARTHYTHLVAAEKDRVELIATVLEDNATRAVDAVANVMAALGEQAVGVAAENMDAFAPRLAQVTGSLPILRGLALVDDRGRVLSSSDEKEVGQVIDLGRLGAMPEPGNDHVGPLLRGRSLARVGRGDLGMADARGEAAVPLVRHLRARDGADRFLIGLLNVERLASFQQLVVKDENTAAVLSSYAGTVLASLPWVPVEPGTRLLQHPLFSDLNLQQQVNGVYEGAGIRPGAQVSAFRISAARPLVVLVEQPKAVIWRTWRADMVPLVLGRLLVLLGTFALTFYVVRALRHYESGHVQRAAPHAVPSARDSDLGELFKLAPQLLFRTDAAGLVRLINPRFAQWSGRTEDAAIGRRFADVLAPTASPTVLALFDPDAGNAPRSAQAELVGEHGFRRLLEVTVSPQYEEGVLVAFVGSAVDLTGRLQREDRLRDQVNHTGRLLELCPVPVSIVDGESRYLSVNRAWEVFNDRPRADVIGRFAGEHWKPSERAAQREIDERLMAIGGSYTADVSYTRIDQSRRRVRVAKVVIPDDEGRPIAILNTFTDLSEFAHERPAEVVEPT